MSEILERLPELLARNDYLLAAGSGALLLVLVAASFSLIRSARRSTAKRNLASSAKDEEKIDRIVGILHQLMRWAGEDGFDEEMIFDRKLYEKLKADEKDLDRLLPRILTKLYEIGVFTLTTSDRMDLEQFVRFFNERTGANIRI